MTFIPDMYFLVFYLMLAQSIVLVSALLTKKLPSRVPNILLSIVIFSVTFVAFNYTLVVTGVIQKLPFLVNTHLPFTYLMPVALYIYFVSITTPSFQFSKNSFFLLLPCLIAVSLSTPLYLASPEVKAEFFYSDKYSTIRHIQFFIGWSFLGTFLGLCFIRLSNYAKKIRLYFSNVDQLKLRWLWVLMGNLAALWVITFFNLLVFNDTPVVEFAQSLMFCFVIYSIGYFALTRTEVFQLTTASIKYQKSSLSEEKIDGIVDRLDLLMKSQKPYLDSNLKLDDLARDLHVSSHALSQALNAGRRQNFFDYVNFHRIQDAIGRINHHDREKTTLLAICYDVGFNSKSTFNAAFRKVTGKTPREFR